MYTGQGATANSIAGISWINSQTFWDALYSGVLVKLGEYKFSKYT